MGTYPVGRARAAFADSALSCSAALMPVYGKA
jgi:hypothetical protein